MLTILLDRVVDNPTVSNRHCLIFSENKGGGAVAILEDLSGNGTFVNEAIVGRNKRRELNDGDEVAILDEARFVFRYPHKREAHGFRPTIQHPGAARQGDTSLQCICVLRRILVYAMLSKNSRNAVGQESGPKWKGSNKRLLSLWGLATLHYCASRIHSMKMMGFILSWNLLPRGELFNWIIMKQKLTEPEARRVLYTAIPRSKVSGECDRWQLKLAPLIYHASTKRNIVHRGH